MPDKHPALDALREQVQRTVNLNDVIASIEAGEFTPEVRDDELLKTFSFLPIEEDDSDRNRAELEAYMEVWRRTKPERNAYVAIFIPEIWKQFEAERTTLAAEAAGLQGFPPESLAKILQNKSSSIFHSAITAWEQERMIRLGRPREEWDARDHAFDRYQRIIWFGRFNPQLDEDSSAKFITRGVNTASSVVWSLAKLVPALATANGISLNQQQVVDIMHKAYGPVVVRFASMNQEVSIALLNKLGMHNASGFDPKYFSLISDGGDGYRLTMDHDALYGFTDSQGERILDKTTISDTTWCPARYTEGTGGIDLIREYFDWTMSIVETNYLPQVVTA